MTIHEEMMKYAIHQAKLAYQHEEVPVGCVITYQDQIIAKGYNHKEKKNNALLHAEIVAIQKAILKMGTWNLKDCTLYVTLEPCMMCTGAIVQSRIGTVVFGTSDPKGGCVRTLIDLQQLKVNHHPIVIENVMKEECAKLLKNFFKERRELKKIR